MPGVGIFAMYFEPVKKLLQGCVEWSRITAGKARRERPDEAQALGLDLLAGAVPRFDERRLGHGAGKSGLGGLGV